MNYVCYFVNFMVLIMQCSLEKNVTFEHGFAMGKSNVRGIWSAL